MRKTRNSVTQQPRKALVRSPGMAYRNCISCHPLRESIDLKKAREQHAAYCRTLADLGLDVIVLPPDNQRPDSCFVEDNAIVHSGRALICRMAREARRGEEDGVPNVLEDYLDVRRAVGPATVEGGDVIHLEDRLISGLGERTNASGIQQLQSWLDVRVDAIEDPLMVHLKSHATYLGDGKMIVTRRFAGHPVFDGFELLLVPEEEEYAADTLTIGDTVLMSSGMKRAHALVRSAGFVVVPLDTSEFEKCEGALTCLSILF